MRSHTFPRKAVRLVLAAAVSFVFALVIAPSAGAFVYWTGDSYVPGPDGDYEFTTTIGRANPNGSGVAQHFIDPGVTGSGLTAGGGSLFWGSHSGDRSVSGARVFGTVGRANLDGTGTNTTFVTAEQNSHVLGAASDDRYVYWATDLSRAGGRGNLGEIGRAKLDGSEVQESFIGLGEGRPSRVAVDTKYIYWNNYPDPRIGRANVNGTGADPDFITTGLKRDEFGIAVDSGHIYWANGSSIGRANVDGTGIDATFIPDAGAATDVAVDSGHVYWANGTSIGRANLDGSAVDKRFIAVAPGGDHPAVGSVAVDRSAVPSPKPPPPTFTPAKPSLNTSTGTATVSVKVSAAGKLAVSGTGVKTVTVQARAGGKVKLAIKPTGAAKRTLDRTGRVQVKVKVTFTPKGRKALTKSLTVTLKKRHR